jgi:hypothetical protein
MSDPDVLLRALVEEPVPPPPALEARALRERIGGRMEARALAAIERGAPVERWRPWMVFAAAACLPLAIWAVVRAPGVASGRAGAALVTDAVGLTTISGDEVRTGPEAAARASLPSGAVVEIGSSSSVRFEGDAGAGAGTVNRDRIELSAGHIDVRVPKLGPGGDLRVHTDDATVVVHGTRFVVERLAAAGARPRTHVAVTEGLVEVDTAQGVRMLTAGMALDVPDLTLLEGASGAATAQATPSTFSTSPAAPQDDAPAPSSSVPGSTLAAENALLADAMRLRREGRPDPAMARLDELLARFPASPLAETARVERLRVLEETGAKERLAREAERYLSDYPRGFARAEARAMVVAARSQTP